MAKNVNENQVMHKLSILELLLKSEDKIKYCNSALGSVSQNHHRYKFANIPLKFGGILQSTGILIGCELSCTHDRFMKRFPDHQQKKKRKINAISGAWQNAEYHPFK